MAYQIQAARLNLRMQKELKLLHTDPPPGVSVRLADDCTLTNINAQVEGPEGTVYAKGFFNIKILIPERYPFHPPNVTFTTPIYHPNIDDGGRICLDILNLPPKGAWQPSLNISTVLTSIGLLLSEPNPDDGLKCEVSREYKYSRPAFDQKARSWTQKYAKPGSNAGGATEAVSHPAVVQAGAEFENAAEECRPGSSGKEMIRGGIGRKLSLGCSLRWDDKKNCEGKENTMVSASTAPGYCSEPLEALNGNGEEPQAQGGKGGQVVVEQVSTIIVPDSESEDEGATQRRRLSLKRKIGLQGKRRAITLD